MKGTSIKAAVFAFASLCCSGLAFNSWIYRRCQQQQATNWHAIIMFAIFVGFTLFIAKMGG